MCQKFLPIPCFYRINSVENIQDAIFASLEKNYVKIRDGLNKKYFSVTV